MTADGMAPPDDPVEPYDGDEPDTDDREQRDAQDLGREFSHRAARPGETGERLGAERDARSNFANARVTADHFVGRDQFNYVTVASTGAGAPLRMVELSPEDRALDRRFVAPSGFGSAEAAVRRRGVVVLRGADGTGRYALARRLLLARTPGPVRRLHPETDLGSLTGTDLEPGGYLLADLDPGAAAKLRAFDLDRLTAELGPDRKLIVTVAATTDPGLERHVVDASPPDPHEVLRSHLAGAVRSADRARTVLADPEVAALCREQLRGASPAQAVRLAGLLAGAREPIAETVRARLTERLVPDLEQWFAGMADPSTQTLAIAVAALGGENYDLVANAADLLARRLEPGERPPEKPAPFGGTRSARLRALGAHLVRSDLAARHGGTAPGLVVRYRERGLARRLLLHIWAEYDAIRPQLLNWLRLCVRSEVPTVRVRAAVATGVLAIESFDHVRSAIILPWARSKAVESRDAAATALSVVAERTELRNAVRELVTAWSTDAARPRLRATAARAWRVTLNSDRAPDGAAALLRRLAADDSAEVVEAVCTSVAEMLEYRDGAFATTTLDLLTAWVTGGDHDARVTGRLGFLLAAADLVHVASDGSARPTLQIHAERDTTTASKVMRLWHATLNSTDLHEEAEEVLAEWARTADRTPNGPALLAWLLTGVAFDHRTHGIVRLAASRWPHAPNSSAAVLAALAGRRPSR